MHIQIAVEGTKDHAKEQIEQTLGAHPNAPVGLKAAAIALANAVPAKYFTGTIEAVVLRDSAKVEATFNFHAEDEVLKPISREHLLERAIAEHTEPLRDQEGELPPNLKLPSHDDLLAAHLQREVKAGRRVVVKEKV